MLECLIARVLESIDYCTDEEEYYQPKTQQTECQQEVEILVVGVQVGICQGRTHFPQLLMAFINHVASAYAHQRILQEYTPTSLPEFEPLQDGEVADAVVAAIVFIFIEEHIKHLAGSRLQIYGIGDAFLDGCHVGGCEMGHAHTILGDTHAVEIAQEGWVDGVADRGKRVDGIVAELSPLLTHLLLANVEVDIVAVLNDAVVIVQIGVTVGSAGLQRLGGERTQTVVAVGIAAYQCCQRQHNATE